MQDQESTNRQIIHAGERFVGHIVAVVIGLLLMIVGIAMGVTIVLLPIGVPIGLAGLLAFLWGLFSRHV
jgi:hypothetical protein